MTNLLLADISSWQPAVLDWQAYAAWSSQVILRASQGVGVPDTHFDAYWIGATGAGIDRIGVYHYAYPGLHPGPAGAVQEAAYFLSVVGTRLRSNDFYMLDFEEAAGTADWALAFVQHIQQQTGRLARIYASLSYVGGHLQDAQLATYPLILADWTRDPNSRPSAPSPWSSYEYLQFTDALSTPIGVVDGNVYLGGAPVAVPQGPFYQVTAGQNGVPASGNAIAAAMGLTWADILAIPGQNPALAGYDPALPSLVGPGSFAQWILLPGFPPPIPPAPPPDLVAAAAKTALKAWLAE